MVSPGSLGAPTVTRPTQRCKMPKTSGKSACVPDPPANGAIARSACAEPCLATAGGESFPEMSDLFASCCPSALPAQRPAWRAAGDVAATLPHRSVRRRATVARAARARGRGDRARRASRAAACSRRRQRPPEEAGAERACRVVVSPPSIMRRRPGVGRGRGDAGALAGAATGDIPAIWNSDRQDPVREDRLMARIGYRQHSCCDTR